MSNPEVIKTENVPKAIGPYSQAINISGFTFTSGQIPLDPLTGELVSDNFQDQVTQTLENIKGILDERKCGLKNIVKLTVYLTDLSKFNDLNMVFEDFWDKWFEGDELFYPSRSAIEVSKLPKDSQIEIEAIFKDVK